jgi:hypothetical protein
MFDTILNHIYAIFIISIHENAFIYFMVAFLLNKMEYIKFRRENLLNIIIPVIAVGIISNTIAFITPDDGLIRYLGSLTSMTFFICLFLRIKGFKSILLCFLATGLMSIVMVIIQLLYFPVVFSALGKTIDYFNEEIERSILLTLPERIIEYSIIVYAFLRKTSKIKIELYRTIKNNRSLRWTSTILIIINIAIMIFIYNIIVTKLVLKSLDIYLQFIIVISLVTLPILNIVLYFTVVYNVCKKQLIKDTIRQTELTYISSQIEIEKPDDVILKNFIENVKSIMDNKR